MDFKDAIREIKEKVDLYDYVSSSGVVLKPTGMGSWKGCCPFHVEKTPSFTVSGAYQRYNCFGCGESGDIFSYICKNDNKEFADVVYELAEQCGISIDVNSDDENTIDYKSLYNILKVTSNFYWGKFNELSDSHPAKIEVSKRLIPVDNKTIVKYGYAPEGNSLLSFLREQGYSDDLIELSGVCKRSEKTSALYDFFRGRLIFFFTDKSGKPIGFSSRRINEDDTWGKYVNSAESPIFHKSKVLYNHTVARKAAGLTNELIVCEGQFDVASFVEAGLENVVAASGTAFTRSHAEECLKIVGGEGRVVFCLDADKAGIEAAAKIFLHHPILHSKADIVTFPDNMDPCDYRQEHGDEALINYVRNNRKGIIEFFLSQQTKTLDMKTPLGRSQYAEKCLPIIKTLNSHSLRESYLRIISLDSMIPINELKEIMNKVNTFTFEEQHEAPAKQQEIITHTSNNNQNNQENYTKTLHEVLKSPYGVLSARIIALSLFSQEWRDELASRIHLFHPFLKPIAREIAYTNTSIIHPEDYKHAKTIELFMNSQKTNEAISNMNEREANDHFKHLLKLLEKKKNKLLLEARNTKSREILNEVETNNIEFLKELLTKNKLPSQ